MAKIIFTLLTTSLIGYFPFANAQSQWDKLPKGKYAVGYQDTILFDKAQTYQFMDYQGYKPFFVGIWYPIKNKKNNQYALYERYFHFNVSPSLNQVRDSVILQFKNTFIELGVRRNMNYILTDSTYTSFDESKQKLFQHLLKTPTLALMKSEYPTERYPVVIYHCGGGGTTEENALMCEYLASDGFVVISSSYQLPQLKTNFQNTTDIHFVANFAKQLSFTNPRKMYYIGHSWGAQLGFIINYEPHPFKKIIGLDTSLEKFSVDFWRKFKSTHLLDSLIRTYPSGMKITLDLISAKYETRKDGEPVKNDNTPQFEFFKRIKSDKINMYCHQSTINHNSFVSQSLIRCLHANQFPQDDLPILQREYNSYLDIVILVKNILKQERKQIQNFLIIK